jgi:Flp pilus assembly protein TadG
MRNVSKNSRLRRLSGDEEGSALVELSIAAFLLFTLVLGAGELGKIAYAAIETSNAAHAAAQYASTSHRAASDYTYSGGTYGGGIVSAAAADTDFNVAVSSISPVCTCANTAYTPTDCTDNNTCLSHNTQMIETITVQTKADYYPLIKWPGGPTKVTLYGNATQQVSNQ